MAEEKILDDFEEISGWNAFTSGQAQLAISTDHGRNGKAMRLDFDFHGGGGFVVARKLFSLEMDESYSFGFYIRGAAPPNIFEFKLVDGSNRNVWRYRVEGFEFPGEWKPLRIRNSQIEFAWGPLGGGPARGVEAIELVVAAGSGGKGTVWIEGLSFRDETYRSTPLVSASGALPGHDPRNVLDPSDATSWRSLDSDADEPQWLLLDFRQEREYGGVLIDWEKGFQAHRFEVQVSLNGSTWSTSYSTTQGGSERSYLYLPHTASRYIRLILHEGPEGRRFGIRRVEIKPHEFSRSINHFFQSIAGEHRAGLYPKYLLGRQTCWTPAGTGDGEGQALLNEEGMVEVDKGSFSIAPFLYTGGRLITWADAALDQDLMKGYLPIPSSQWKTESLIMRVTPFAAGETGSSILYIRYRIENLNSAAQSVVLFAAILPFQVTPPWQNWRAFGGVVPIRELSFNGSTIRVNDNKLIIPLSRASGFGAASFDEGGVCQSLSTGELPPRSEVKDGFGYASGAIRFDLELASGSATDVFLAIPFGRLSLEAASSTEASLKHIPVSERSRGSVRHWETRLDSVQIGLPPQAKEISDTFKTAAAHILVNRDGPELHPGPRRYARSWIRDGAVMGAALLRAGCNEPIRDFIRWYKNFQTEEGKIPDCVDWEGTEWLPEFDAYGEFIYAVMEYYRFTGDRAFLMEMRPAVKKAMAFMEGLRLQRLTDEYRQPEKQACYGLLPESMSHEGYMAHPVHAYWDDFWALRGIRDASAMEEALGDRPEAMRLASLGDTFSEDLRVSLRATMDRHGIDFLPGSVEFGDFDPAATSIAVSLLDQLHLLPQPETDRTFDRYFAGFRERAAGAVNWNNYSAYEIRIIGALIRLGRRRDALELTRFMMADRRIPAWNQWPEISWRDPLGPSFVGDLPHTWISGEFILAVRSMFAYESEADESLVIAAGVDQDWLADGFAVGVTNLPTHYGKMSYRMHMERADALCLSLEGDLSVPRGGIVVRPPLPRSIQKVSVNEKSIEEFTADRFTCRQWPAEAVVSF